MSGWWGGYEADPVVRQALMYGASQDPAELHAAMDLVASVDPKVILEIGCDRGGTLYAWRQAAPKAQVWGITLADNSAGTGGSGRELVDHGAAIVIGDSHDPRTFWWFAGQMGEPRIDVLVIDGDHSETGVRLDLGWYGPLVAPGGLILLHDIHSVPPRPGFALDVPAVWAQIKLDLPHNVEEIHNAEGGQGWGVIRVPRGGRGDWGTTLGWVAGVWPPSRSALGAGTRPAG